MSFIDGFWEYVGEGDVIPIAALADETLRKLNRPFRVAIDAAGLYSAYNLNPPTITPSRPRRTDRTETSILFRLADLLRRNVRPILIFDGPAAVLAREKVGNDSTAVCTFTRTGRGARHRLLDRRGRVSCGVYEVGSSPAC